MASLMNASDGCTLRWKRVWNATGVARGSILAGLKELEQVLQEQQGPANKKRRIRRQGAGLRGRRLITADGLLDPV